MTTIAVIEDDLPIGNLLEEVLEQQGYAVRRAYSGTEALYLLERETPDLALLDLMLPGLPGEEVLPHLQGIPVIVLSARAGLEDKVTLLLDGAADYLTKPVSYTHLFQLLEGKAQSAHALGLHILRVKLVLPGRLVHGNPPPDEHLHAVFRAEFQTPCRRGKHHRLQH